MLGGAAANLFEGLDSIQQDARAQAVSRARRSGHRHCQGHIGFWNVLLHCDNEQTATLIAFTAQKPAPAPQSAVQNSTESNPVVIKLQTSCGSLPQPTIGGVLLQACQQGRSTALQDNKRCSTYSGSCLSGLQSPCWLMLTKHGSRLELFVVEQSQQQPCASQEGHVLLSLEHDSFGSLTAQQCWVFPGPVLLLHPELEHLLLVSTVDTVPASEMTGITAAAASRSAANGASQLLDQQWQVTEMHVTSQDIMRCLDLQCVQQLLQQQAAATVPVWMNGREQENTNITAQPCDLLHCQAAGHHLQLLISMVVAAPAADTVDRSAVRQRQAGQQQTTLLLWLKGTLGGCPVAEPGVDCSDSGVQLVCCYATGWDERIACAAVADRVDAKGQQLVVIGNSAGGLQLLLHTERRAESSGHWQLQDHSCSDSKATLQTAGEVHGAIVSVHILPEVLIAGSLQTNVLAVQHQPSANSNTYDSSRQHSTMTSITLLVERAGQLQTIAEIPGVRGILVPDGSSPWGLLCPWQNHSAGSEQSAETPADSDALQLAAFLIMDLEGAEAAVGAAAASLHCCAYAQLSVSHMDDVMGSVLGLVRRLPGDIMLPMKQQQQPAAQSAEPGLANSDRAAAAAAATNELRGLQAMAAVLDRHWQRECVDLAALQHRFSHNLRVTAAAHAHLCQVAADTIQTSTAHQYSLPLSQLDSQAAAAAYTTGKHIQQQQQAGFGDPHSSSSLQDRCLRLVLEIISHSSQLTTDELQLVVQVKPVLHLQHQRGGSAHALPSSAVMSWRGPLLQVCHAELLLWHTDGLAVASQTNWQWDTVAGVVMVQASVPRNQLLSLVQQQGVSRDSSIGMTTQRAGLSPDSSEHRELQDHYVGVAEAIAAAVSQVAEPSPSPGQTGTNSSSRSSSSVQLGAAVVVAACCSNQAAAQMQMNKPNSSRALQGHSEEVLLRHHLLTPRTALLHLPAVTLSLRQLLMPLQGDTAAHANSHQSLQQADCNCTQAQGPVIASVLQTPARGHVPEQHSPKGQTVQGSELQALHPGFTHPDVVPPTPWDDSQMMQVDDDQQQYQHEMVVEDSQPEDNNAAVDDHHQQPSVADLSGRTTDDVMGKGLHMQDKQQLDQRQMNKQVQQQQQYDRQLLLRGPAAALLQLPIVLIELHGFLFQEPAAADTAQQPQSLTAALHRLSHHLPGDLVHINLRLPGRPDCHDSRCIELVYMSGELVHVLLSASSSHQLQLLQLMLVAAAQELPEGEAVEINVSPLSSNRHASLLAATNALSQAVHLHSRVLEDVLRQLHARQQHSVVRAPSAAAVGMQQATSSARDAPNTEHSSMTRQQDLARASDVCGAEQSGVLFADGMYMGDDLSQCWVALCQSQAQVDLAVSQLAAHQ